MRSLGCAHRLFASHHFAHRHLNYAASVYTEMNAITKGVSLGVFDKNRGKGVEASSSGSQPYVDLMGRRLVHRLHTTTSY